MVCVVGVIPMQSHSIQADAHLGKWVETAKSDGPPAGQITEAGSGD
jgi:hypothetical protein